eukprot:TRINITY_DN3098_c0_g4_i2.p1 TRINITY_DN3098_c0_g4~~TRINITY_DN3098_c0_g4_i2.p1  ORF type:complete len:313 (+),score=47.51 TRINITY_DN3098_c0_g4_i2:61-999(+)
MLGTVLGQIVVQIPQPTMSYIGIQSVLMVCVCLSALMSFSISITFHTAIRASSAGGIRTYRSASQISMIAVTLIHIVLLIVVNILFITPTSLGTLAPWGVLCTVFFVLFKLWISLYFFWAQCVTLKLYTQTTAASLNGSYQLKKMGRRLGITSFLNLLSLVTISIALSKYFHERHGWILICWNSIPMSLIAIAEIKCVPSEVRTKRGSKIGSPVASVAGPSRQTSRAFSPSIAGPAISKSRRGTSVGVGNSISSKVSSPGLLMPPAGQQKLLIIGEDERTTTAGGAGAGAGLAHQPQNDNDSGGFQKPLLEN